MAKAEGQNKSEVIIKNPQAVRLSEADSLLYPQLTDIFFQAWHNEGLCENPDTAERKVYSFDPEEAFAVIDKDTGLALAMINTLPVEVANIEDLCRKFPTYSSVEFASISHHKATFPNFRICFSVVATPGFRVLRGESSQTESLASFLLRNLPQNLNIHQIAYSRYSNIAPNTKLADYYLANLDDPKMLGPVGMHEHLGGLAVAFLEGSRPEDLRGGGGNILVLYPNTPEEQQHFDHLKKARRTQKRFLPLSLGSKKS